LAIFEQEIATYTGASTTYANASTVARGTAPDYSVKEDGRILGLKLVVAGDAVTSLLEMVMARVTFPNGDYCEVATAGGQIRTAPAFPIPVGIAVCEEDVKKADNLKCEFKHPTGATPVTPRISLIMVFQK